MTDDGAGGGEPVGGTQSEAGGHDVVFVGGRIVTMHPGRPVADALSVGGGRIIGVGRREDVSTQGARVVDLGGRMLVPGFIDAHNHLSIAALQPRWADASAAGSVEDLLAAVASQAAADPDAGWVRLWGWRGAEGGVAVTGRDLDRLGLDRPVVVAHSSLHMAVVNGAGLAELGIGRATPAPPGGEIERDPHGMASGVLVERAWSEAHRRSLAAYADPERWAQHIADRAHLLVAEGVTAVHDAACSPQAEAVYRAMAQAGSLPVSVLALPHPAALLSHDFAGRLDGPCSGEGDEAFRVGPAKLFADGGIAIALDVRIGGHEVHGGLLMEDLEVVARAATDRGWDLAVHAIGNVGVERTLEVIEATARRRPGRAPRCRIEHALVTEPSQWRRLGALGVIGVVQPGFVEHVGTQSGGVRFDEHRWLAFAGLAAAGVTLAGSSDDPCAPFPPLWCAHKGTTRHTDAGISLDPEQSVPMEEWLAAYTIGAALAGGQEAERGSLEPGKRADLVVLDPVAGPGEVPWRVSETWIGGERAFPA